MAHHMFTYVKISIAICIVREWSTSSWRRTTILSCFSQIHVPRTREKVDSKVVAEDCDSLAADSHKAVTDDRVYSHMFNGINITINEAIV